MIAKQKQIGAALGITQAMVSMLQTGKRPISWPIAQQLARLFPNKDIETWKNATSEEFKQVWEQYFTAKKVA